MSDAAIIPDSQSAETPEAVIDITYDLQTRDKFMTMYGSDAGGADGVDDAGTAGAIDTASAIDAGYIDYDDVDDMHDTYDARDARDAHDALDSRDSDYSDCEPDGKFYDTIRRVIAKGEWRTDKTVSADPAYPKIGDIVRVTYTPNSQKYIEHYASLSFVGTVFFVDEATDNFFAIVDQPPGSLQSPESSNAPTIRSHKVEGCHFFGMTDSYHRYFEILK